MASFTVFDGGRTLSAQTVEACWNSIAMPICSASASTARLGPDKLRPYIEELSRVAPRSTSVAIRTPGLPNAFGEFDETPEMMARTLGEFAAAGWLNIVGGCCGTTPAHIRAIAAAVAELAAAQAADDRTAHASERPRAADRSARKAIFSLIGERTNITGSKKFSRLILGEKFEEAVAVARQQVESGANVIDVNMDEALLDGEAAMTQFLNLIAAEPEVARVPIMVDSSKWSVIEAGLKCVQGKGIVNSISLKEGEEAFLHQARLVRRYGAAVVVMAFDEQGQATASKTRCGSAERAYRLLTEAGRHAADRHHLRSEHSDRRHRHRGAQPLRDQLLRSHAAHQASCPGVKISGGVSNVSFSFRGNEVVREAMHAAFLYHAIRAGMDMGIVNAGQLAVYEEIPKELLERGRGCAARPPARRHRAAGRAGRAIQARRARRRKPNWPGAAARSKSG